MKDTAHFKIGLHPGHYLFHPCSPIQTSAIQFARRAGIRLGIMALKMLFWDVQVHTKKNAG